VANREELQDTEEITGILDRERGCAHQTGLGGGFAPHEARVVAKVREPDRLALRPGAAREAAAGRESQPAAVFQEALQWRGMFPQIDEVGLKLLPFRVNRPQTADVDLEGIEQHLTMPGAASSREPALAGCGDGMLGGQPQFGPAPLVMSETELTQPVTLPKASRKGVACTRSQSVLRAAPKAQFHSAGRASPRMTFVMAAVIASVCSGGQ